MHPACPNKKQNHLQNSLLRRNQFWVRKTFSKPASLKRASLVALLVAISHKLQLKPKHCASSTLMRKIKKNELKHTVGKEQKRSIFTVLFLGPSSGTKNETAKSQNQQQRPTRATNKKLQLRFFKQQASRFGTAEVRTCAAWFQLTFRPQKWNPEAHMRYQLSPFPGSNVAIAMQHHPGNSHQSFATPHCPATPCYVLIQPPQSPNVIDTIWNEYGVRKPSLLHLPTSFPKQILTPSRFKYIYI